MEAGEKLLIELCHGGCVDASTQDQLQILHPNSDKMLTSSLGNRVRMGEKKSFGGSIGSMQAV